MQVQFKIAMNEIEYCPELSYYNNIVWKFKYQQKTGLTHFIEKYDDVSVNPDYKFGYYKKDEFIVCESGEGNPIDKDDVGFGGRYVVVDIFFHNNLTK